MSRLRLEFTVEPFVDGAPGAHVSAALDAVRAAGLTPVMGPFSNTAEGDQPSVLDAVARMAAAALDAGASRLSIHIDAVDVADRSDEPDEWDS
jgi:uncharacterized protein YqgV (UPF0045/DUF77 family)